MDSVQTEHRIPRSSPEVGNMVTLKVVSIFVLLLISVIGGVIPVMLVRDFDSKNAVEVRRRERVKRIVSVMNAFSGGVFLAIALVHLLPQVDDLFYLALKDASPPGVANYPWAGLCASCGFFLIVLIEQVIYTFQEKVGSISNLALIHGHGHSHGNHHVVVSTIDADECTDLQSGEPVKLDKKDGESGVSNSGNQEGSYTVLSAVVLSLALSVHSVLEGLALGLQLTRTGTLDLFIALALHKGIESFTISLSVVQATANKAAKYFTFIFFSITTPVGIAIGIPVASQESTENRSMLLANGIMQGLATGTFMFITFIEILPTELSAKGDRMLKFLFMILGFGIIAGVTSLEFK